MEIVINAERFYQRLERLQEEWLNHKSSRWGSSDALCIPLGPVGDDLSYSKQSSVHIFLFGYEFADSLVVMTKNNFYFMASAKKCAMLETHLVGKHDTFRVHLLTRTKDERSNRAHFNTMMGAVRHAGGKCLGSLFKVELSGTFIPSWVDFVNDSQIEKFEISPPLGLFLAKKDDSELEMCKRAAVLSNKVMKHAFVAEMERILDADEKKSHADIAEHVESILLDPTKINIKISLDACDVCYAPIVQSGGKYDIKPSALSNTDNLRPDVILCSLGARYKAYCANISRCFLVDAPKKVENTYATLLGLYNACLEQMYPGNELKSVVEAARSYLQERHPELLPHLPKTLGFALGLEFRDSTMLLNATNSNKFAAGMVFNLSVGLHNVALSAVEKSGAPEAIQKLDVFSLLLADVVSVQKEGVPDVLTKFSKEFSDISYNIGDKDEEDGDIVDLTDENGPGGVRRSRRAQQEKAVSESAAAERTKRQQELMQRRIDEGRRRMQKEGAGGDGEDDEQQIEARELETYPSPAAYSDASNHRLKVDLSREALLVPIHGRLVPFHISTIKNMTNPDPDMRINFYIPGTTLSKEVPKNMQQLVLKYGDKAVFIKELTFRATDGKNLPTVFQQYQELRRRVRQREQKAEQEKGLVAQEKLIRIKDQRIPRLQEVAMRPSINRGKCVGQLEAHQNGLLFRAAKSPQENSLEVMYNNIKHAIFQPCDKSTMVLVHFNLHNPIMIGKKKHSDVQFYTEVIEASENLASTKAQRNAYDPDEIEGENREREMRRRLNMAFRDFCTKVENVAKHYEYDLQIDAPFKKSGFMGNHTREMVLLQPTTNCLVNLTEWPSFVLTLSEVEHVHFERVTYATKAFDITFIFKDWNIVPRTITAIQTQYMDRIEDWLNLVEITYTKAPRAINWTEVMKIVRSERDIFWDDVDDDGEKRPPGWSFLSAEDGDGSDEDDGDEESSFEGGSDESSEEEEDSDDESDFSEEDDSEEDDDDEEEGEDWDDLEKKAREDDRKRKVEEMAEHQRAQSERDAQRGGRKMGRR